MVEALRPRARGDVGRPPAGSLATQRRSRRRSLGGRREPPARRRSVERAPRRRHWQPKCPRKGRTSRHRRRPDEAPPHLEGLAARRRHRHGRVGLDARRHAVVFQEGADVVRLDLAAARAAVLFGFTTTFWFCATAPAISTSTLSGSTKSDPRPSSVFVVAPY